MICFSFGKLWLYLQKGNIMKNKFETTEGNLLGSTVQTVRRSKAMTQEQLGKLVGISKSGISKIEKGLTHISAEDASILLEAMGERLVLDVPGLGESSATREQKSRFLTTSVAWFAEESGLTFARAYQFLLVYKGIDFLENNFRYEQTLPRATVLGDLQRICAKNGGTL